MYFYASKSIRRSIDVVWNVVTDIGLMDDWSPVDGPADLRVQTEGDLVGVGSRLIRHYKRADGSPIGESIVEVTDFDPPRRLSLSAVDLDMDMTFTVQLDRRSDDLTVVSMRNGNSNRGGVIEYFTSGRAQRRLLARTLTRLKRLTESGRA